MQSHPQDKPQPPKPHRLPKGLLTATPGEQLAFQNHFQFRQLLVQLPQFRLGFPVFVTAQMCPHVDLSLMQFRLLRLTGLHLGIPGFQVFQVVFQLVQGLLPVGRGFAHGGYN